MIHRKQQRYKTVGILECQVLVHLITSLKNGKRATWSYCKLVYSFCYGHSFNATYQLFIHVLIIPKTHIRESGSFGNWPYLLIRMWPLPIHVPCIHGLLFAIAVTHITDTWYWLESGPKGFDPTSRLQQPYSSRPKITLTAAAWMHTRSKPRTCAPDDFLQKLEAPRYRVYTSCKWVRSGFK
jgi:hypothetical protein